MRTALLLALVAAAPAFGQLRWQRSYGRSGDDRGLAVALTADSGYIVAGQSNSFGPGDNDVYLIRVNSMGDTLWTRTYGGDSEDLAFSVQATPDGGFIVAGWTTSFGAGAADIYLVKTDSAGETLWTRTYGGLNAEFGHSVQPTPDGGYIVAGTTASFGAGNRDVYMVKTDASGETLWTRTFGGPGDDEGNSVQLTRDSGYVVAGQSNSFGAGDADVYLIKINASGDTLWTRTCGDTQEDCGCSVQQASDGGYIVAGSTGWADPATSDICVIRTDAAGNTLWTFFYRRDYCDCANSVQPTANGDFVIAGVTGEFGPGNGDALLIRLNADGETLWTRTYGGPYYEWGYGVRQTADAGFVVAGYTFSAQSSFNVFLVKTDAMGSAALSDGQPTHDDRRSELEIKARPSVIRSVTLFSFALPAATSEAQLEIQGVSGRRVRTFVLSGAGSARRLSLTWDGTDDQGRRLPAGCYFCLLRAGRRMALTRVTKVR